MKTHQKEYQNLISRAQNGDLDAFGDVVTQFQNMSVGYAYSILGNFHLAEDAAQEAFISAFRDLKSIREPKAFPSWLRRLIFKQCDRLTRGKHIEVLPLETGLRITSDRKEPETAVLEQETQEHVLAAVKTLSENERVAVTLFYLNEYSQKEISRFLEIPISTINGRLQAARKHLSVILGPEIAGERITKMVRENLMKNIPSRDDKFANRVQLFNAVEAGQLEKARALLTATPELINLANSSGQTPLHRASYRGHEAIIQLLIDRGADVDAKDKNDQTPLHLLAIISVMTHIAKLMIDAGADVNARDKDGNTPLFLSLAHNFHKLRGSGNCSREFWELLDKNGAEMDGFTAALYSSERLESLLQSSPELVNGRRGSDNWTPLHYVADLGFYPDTAKVLLRYGADVNAQDSRGHTPLQLATHRLATEIEYFFGGSWSWTIEVLMDHGAGEDVFDNAALGRWERLNKLWKKDRKIFHSRNRGGNTPLHIAAWNGQRDAIQFFMATVGNLEPENNEGKTPIQMAVDDGHRSVAEMLLRRGAKCDIFTAAELGVIREVESKLQEDPSLASATDHEGKTLLQRVSARWRKEKFFWREWRYEPKEEALLRTMDLLLGSGAEVDIWTAASIGKRDNLAAIIKNAPALIDAFEEDLAPIHCAALMGHAEVIELLLDNGASTHTRGVWSFMPLHIASWADQREAAEALLKRGADIEARTGQGMTSLYIATYEGQFSVVELLVEYGADVNSQPGVGASPLLEAIWHNHTETAKYLISHGADVNFNDMWGQSPLLNAVKNADRYEIIKCLLEHGADANASDRDGKTPLTCATERGHEAIANILRQYDASE